MSALLAGGGKGFEGERKTRCALTNTGTIFFTTEVVGYLLSVERERTVEASEWFDTGAGGEVLGIQRVG